MEEPRYRELKIPCPKHEHFIVTHGCSNIDCSRDPLFCSQCLIENLEHVNEHKNFIAAIPRFIVDFFHGINAAREKLRPFEEVYTNRVSHLSFYSKFIQEQKEYIAFELRTLLEHFTAAIDQIRIDSFTELDNLERQLSMYYENMDSSFQSPEIALLQLQHHSELAHRLHSMPITQAGSFLLSIRSAIHALKDPNHSSIIQNLARLSQTIHAFRKRADKHALALTAHAQPSLKPLFADTQSRIVDYVSSIVRPESLGGGGNEKSMFDMGRTNQSFTPQKSTMKSMAIKEDFPLNNAMTSQLDLTSTQKKSTLKKDLKGKVPKFNLIQEASFNEAIPISAFAVVSLSDEIIGVACKDSYVRLYRISNANTALELIPLGKFQNREDNSAFWSLCSIVNPGKGIIQFAAGSENGVISLWKVEEPDLGSYDSRPAQILKGTEICEIITCLLDLEDDTHIFSGDSTGLLLLWDYTRGAFLSKYSYHTGQINTMCSYNNGESLAVGGYDSIISLWEISRNPRSNVKIELNCIKVITNNYYVYSLTPQILRGTPTVIISDSQRNVKYLDTLTHRYIAESERYVSSEPILEVISLQCGEDLASVKVFLLAFTKSQMVIIDGETQEPLQYFEAKFFSGNNIGYTMSSCYKVVALPNDFTKDNESLLFAIVDQGNKSQRVVTLFRVSMA